MKGEEEEGRKEQKEKEEKKWGEEGKEEPATAGDFSTGSEQPWPHSPVRPQWVALIVC